MPIFHRRYASNLIVNFMNGKVEIPCVDQGNNRIL